jgi:hypothetical protein
VALIWCLKILKQALKPSASVRRINEVEPTDVRSEKGVDLVIRTGEQCPQLLRDTNQLVMPRLATIRRPNLRIGVEVLPRIFVVVATEKILECRPLTKMTEV